MVRASMLGTSSATPRNVTLSHTKHVYDPDPDHIHKSVGHSHTFALVTYRSSLFRRRTNTEILVQSDLVQNNTALRAAHIALLKRHKDQYENIDLGKPRFHTQDQSEIPARRVVRLISKGSKSPRAWAYHNKLGRHLSTLRL
jgi:hypothetical protein